MLRGNNGGAIASALNRYLEEFCHCETSWNCGDQLAIGKTRPPVDRKIRVVSPHRFRYAYNYCTHGYTMAWWDWPRWEHELDFLALKGVNLALIIEGQEGVWINSLQKFGYTESEVRHWLCMPSHQPWQYMSNIEDYGGPVPSVVIEKRIALGRKIIKRMRELGMEPVLQGYYGIVPSDFKSRFPVAKIHPQGEWGGLKRPDMLDPLDPFFAKVAAAFYDAQIKLFGAAQFLAADPFHEGGSTEGMDLAACGQAIYGAMARGNLGVTWVLQSWLENPRQPMIDGLNKSNLLVLDLFCERKENWRERGQFGHTPWLWGTIQNWGGNIGLGGEIDTVRVKPADALAAAGPGKGEMRGIGALMEGSGTQPLLWEMFLGNAWRSDAPELGPWLRDYALRRYGDSSSAALQALQIETETVYAHPGYVESAICARPSLDAYPKARFWGSTKPDYDTRRLVDAWKRLLDAADVCGGSDGYCYDLADMGRQVLSDLAGLYYRGVLQAYTRKDSATVSQLRSRMLGLIRDLDQLLATRREFLLGVWLADARKYGTTRDEQDLCERNARELLTTWAGQDTLNIPNSTDYANRQWAGLVGTFYFSRWEIWLDAMQSAVASGQAIDVEHTHVRIRENELGWTRLHDVYPIEPQGRTIAVSRRLFEKYSADASGKTLGAVSE
ncbi:MAG TPA: alpha-N-acetylglucosaminidase TIM-barrel domain-containing protein [Bacteroidota bacterium]|nr:alpha-N-acetylglucosaminidase TIM-barrel domain-containing protein [Bacteroidota bacterium]